MLKIQKYLNYIRLNINHNVFLRKYKELKKLQRLSYKENQERQLNKLNTLLNHANIHVPYYRELFKSINIIRDGKIKLKDISELSKIPVLTKEIIRSEKDRMYSDDIVSRHTYKNTSGGSTGEPVEFIQDSQYNMSNRIHTQSALFWQGYGVYDDMIIIWGATRDTFTGKKSLKQKLVEFYHNRITLNSFSMSDNDKLEYIKLLNKHQPKLIKAYAHSIYEIARFAKKNKVYVKKQNSIHLAASAINIHMRKVIEEVFQCKTYNYYGSREIGSIASECKMHDGLHIMMDHIVVEVLDDNNTICNDGKQGEITTTTLNNYSMPLIRYKIGDIGIKSSYNTCKCGINYHKLETIVGRTTDIFKTITGSSVDGEYFTHLFYFRENIRNFQVVQNQLDILTIKIVKDGYISEETLNDIKQKIKIVMGDSCQVIFEFVDEIPKTLTGKYKYTISNLSINKDIN